MINWVGDQSLKREAKYYTYIIMLFSELKGSMARNIWVQILEIRPYFYHLLNT